VANLTLILAGTLLSVLLAATTYAAVEYYRQLRRAQKEYERARDFVEDIVLSFNRELKREAERIEKVASKVEMSGSKADAGFDKAENIERRIIPLESQIGQIGSQVESITTTISALSKATSKAVEYQSNFDLSNVNAKVHNIESSQENLINKISNLEDQMQKLSVIPEFKDETPLPVMPIKRDKALSVLTDTEVAVLEFLSAEGPKTAPEIKEKVHLSREHTARLMKRLYEEGYLERETIKLPFKYSVKKEMERLLRKTEETAAK
jgi:DNA-binding MarR family transcriptional regulator